MQEMEDLSLDISPNLNNCHAPIISRENTIRLGMLIGLIALLTACGVGEVKTQGSSISPTPEGLGGTVTETLPAATATAKPTETAQPTEIPLFTEAEKKAMDPFDTSENLNTWPERFAKTQLHPELATEQEWQDEYQFVLAGREDKGILRIAEQLPWWNGNPMLQSLHNGLNWEADNIDKTPKIAVTPVEKRAMIEEARKFGKLATTDKANQTYKSESIGQILGRDINSKRRPFDVASGKLAGIGTIGKQDDLIIDIQDTTDGYHILFSTTVYVEKGITLPKGSKCVVTNKSWSNTHGGSAVYLLPRDIELSPLIESGKGNIITWENLYAGIGKTINIEGGGYRGELGLKTGVSALHCFSPGLNLEIANWLWFPPQS